MAPSRYHALSTLALVIVALVLYRGGLTGPFVFDDLSNILQVPSVALTHLDIESLLRTVRSEDGAWLRRPIARLSFALNYYFAGSQFDPLAYKLTNLAVHCASGVLAYVLVYQLLCHRAKETLVEPPGSPVVVAFAVAVVWLAHPIQLTSVLYVVQRMTSLSGMFVLGGLVLYTLGRRRLATGADGAWLRMVGGVAIGTVLGGLCKEIAVLTPLFALAIDWFFFEPGKLSAANRRKLARVHGAMMLMLIAPASYWLWSAFDHVFSVYSVREFGPLERVLTQARVLFFYVQLILFPDPRNYGLFHDDIVFSTGFFEPPTTAISLFVWLGVITVTLRATIRRRLWAFGIVWFLVGHCIESTVLGLELVHEHRNYLPSLGLLFAVVWLAAHFFPVVVQRRSLRIAFIVMLAATTAFVTWSRVGNWSDRLILAQSWVRNHPASYRSLDSLAFAYRERGESIELVYDTYRRASELDRAQILPLVEMVKVVQALRLSALEMPSQHSGHVRFSAEPLKFDRRWLYDAVAALDAEIERRLRDYRLGPSTSLALFNLFVCDREGDVICSSLSSANLRWHRIANLNSRVSDFDKQRLRLTLEALEAGDDVRDSGSNG